jgi:Ca-activated chloride channel family protein
MCFHRRRIPRHLLLEAPANRFNYGRALKWFLLLIMAVMLAVVASVAKARAYQEEHYVPGRETSSSALYTSGSGHLYLRGSEGGLGSALHHESEAQVTIKGMLAKVVLRQTFENNSNEWVEGIYVFPLGETAAVNHMVMEVGERRILAQIKEKQEAERMYQEARREGRRAALTEQQRPNLFTQSIANIAPGEVVTIELHFHEAVSYADNTFRWRLPTSLTPRYIPGAPLSEESLQLPINGWSLPTDQVPDAHRITPFMDVSKALDAPPLVNRLEKPRNPIRIQLRLDAGLPLAEIRGSYHQLRLHKNGDVHSVTTVPEMVSMDRDFEISWKTPAGQSPDAAFFTEEVKGEDYGLLMVLPPQQALQQRLPREVIFIIDTSGSMSGTSIRQARQSLLMALERLQSTDRFNVIEFNSEHFPLFDQPRYAGSRELKAARRFVEKLEARGGTEMAAALQTAMASPAPEGYLKQLVFITDGSVGNETALLQMIHQQLGDARLFTVGIGSAPNSFFMRKAAEFGRGTFTFVGSQQEVGEKMQALFSKLETPVLSNLKIEWPLGLNAEVWPKKLPDLYQGEPLLVSVKFEGKLPPGSQIRLSGEQAGQTWSRDLLLTPANSKRPAAGVSLRWARAKIEALLDEKTRGRHEDEVRAQVLQLALEHQLVSPYTSLVAVEEIASRPQGEGLNTEPVANLLPHGQTLQALSYPQTATAAGLQMLMGMLAFFGLLLLRFHSRLRRARAEIRAPLLMLCEGEQQP